LVIVSSAIKVCAWCLVLGAWQHTRETAVWASHSAKLCTPPGLAEVRGHYQSASHKQV